MSNQNRLKQKLEEGLTLHRAGSFEEAKKIYQQVLLERSDDPDAHHFLGIIANQLGDIDEAVRLISRAIEFENNRPTFHFNLGAALIENGQRSDAISAYKIAARLKPDWAEAHYNLGSLSWQSGNVKIAETSLRRAIELKPTYHEAISNLAAIFTTQGKLDQASRYCQQAIELAPDFVEAWTNWGNALEKLNRHDEAETAHRKATVKNPDYAVGHYNLGNLLTNFWKPDDGAKCYRNALEADSEYLPARDNLLMNLLYDPSSTEALLYEEHVKWAGQTKIIKYDQVFHNNRNRDRRLRIGYVSPDFRTHSCASFLEPLFAAHDPQRVEVFAYANVARPDEVTKRLKSLVDQWRDISTLDVSDICVAIQNDQIDILIDLAGHSANNSLKVFRMRPAPIQVAWLGYPGTTGLVEMDYRLTDAIADPEGDSDDFHSETLIRLPEGFLCYASPTFPPEIGDPPNKSNGYVTFGSFNNLLKVTPQVIDTWSVILKSVPDSRLLLKGRILNISRTRSNILSSFTDRGIEEERIELSSWIRQDQSPMKHYNQVDIALDTFPYNGTTTTFEALFMGVPVVAVKGTRHSGRVGASILNTLKLQDLLAESISDYQNRAVDLAQSEERLKFYRENLRTTLDISALMDGPAFAGKLEAAYRKIWHDWCLS